MTDGIFIDPAKFVVYIGVSWALIVAPGPDMFYVLTRGMAYGRRGGIISAFGVVCGIFIHTTAAALGLTLILQTSAPAFLLIKYGGALYLLYLGLKTWLDTSTMHLPSSGGSVPSNTLFWQGVASNVLNPKIALFFLAFLPQFVEQGNPNAVVQMIVLGVTFACFGLCFLLAIGYGSGAVGTWIMQRPKYAQWFRRVSGGLLIGLGLRLAAAER